MLLHFLDAAKFESLEIFQQDYSDLSHGDQVTHMLTKPSQHTASLGTYPIINMKWSCVLSCSSHTPMRKQSHSSNIPPGSFEDNL